MVDDRQPCAKLRYRTDLNIILKYQGIVKECAKEWLIYDTFMKKVCRNLKFMVYSIGKR